MHNLLDILVDVNFYTKLYSLQILASILECRGPQLRECVMNSPTGTNVLVGVLDERREQLRNEGLLLLLGLVKSHQEIQKRVAFENAFEKTIAIVHEEGGLEGGIVTSDCFRFLHNLLSSNVSNQNWFRETEFFKSIAELLTDIEKGSSFSTAFASNVIALLRIVRLFIAQDTKDKMTNQNAFMKSGLVTHLVGLAFAGTVPQAIRAEALVTLSDMISNNAPLQDYFIKASSLARDPLYLHDIGPNDISALLDILLNGGEDAFEMRHAASLCIQSFANGSHERKIGIVQLIVDSYLDSKPNNLLESVLVFSPQTDQYRTWFSCNTLLHLTHGDEDTRDMMTSMTIGDSEAGEEEVSLIQTISSNAVTALQNKRFRSASAYLMILSSWLFDSFENVADFLEENSTLQALIGSLQADTSSDLIRGLCACLLSICYAFDFSERTTVNRAALQALLMRIGREAVVGSIVTFSQSDVFRRRDINQPSLDKPLLDETYTDFFRDNYGLIRKAIDQPPLPVRSKKEELVQEEQERTEDIIADLEAELERKSSGLDEAVSIIKTRQEELQRLREEAKYTTQKHKVEFANAQAELERQRHEITQLRAEATRASNDIDKSLRESSVLHSELQQVRSELHTAQQEHTDVNKELEHLKNQVESESSKRSFLENELKNLREVSRLTSEQTEILHIDFEKTTKQLRHVTAEFEEAKLRLVQTSTDLAQSRSAQKKAEAEVVSSRTKARDLDTELKGLQHEVQINSQQQIKERLKMKDAQDNLERRLNEEVERLAVCLEDKKQLESRHAAQISKAAEEHSLEVAKLRARTSSLEDEVAKIISSAMNTKNVATDGNIHTNGEDTEASLRKQLELLKVENEDIRKQLEQAQEDLMLLMEDDGPVDDS